MNAFAMLFLGIFVGVGVAMIWRAVAVPAPAGRRVPLALVGLALMAFAAWLAWRVLGGGAAGGALGG